MQSIATPRIEAVPSVTVNLPPSFEQPAEPLRAPPPVVDGEIVATVDDYQPPSPPPSRRWRVPALIGAIAVVSLVLGGALGLVLSPLLFASATITLTPEAHSLTTATSVSLPVRLFTADHESLRRTIAATGTATRPATAARGSITFYNALPAPQTVSAGTLLVSASGVPVLTEEDAYIPAASPPTEGVATVIAHAENTGSTGNIAAGTISGPCCRAYVLADNGGFSGGADARTYRTPTAADIANALAPLRSQLDSRLHSAIHTWLQHGEVLLPPTCHTTTSSSAQPGAEADQVTVTVGETCSAAAYNASELHQAVTTTLSGVASHQFGPAYRLAGVVHTEITATTVTSNHARVQLHLSGLFSYRFSPHQLVQLRSQLAGVSRDRALVILNHLAGVTQARIQSGSATLPDDPSRIRILLSQ